MILDVKIPRWAAALVLTVWILSLVESMVAQAISTAANLKYLQDEQRTDPPPPWPGQPALTGPEKDKDETERRRLRRARKEG